VNCCKKKFKETQKIGNPNNNEGNEQVDNNKQQDNANPTTFDEAVNSSPL
jgi:hypothetical protein